MKFSIITPSFNQLSYLKRCVASVADQQGVDVEHIVIDGGSSDGTGEWLRDAAEKHSTDRYHLSFISEADQGMYDALNKGFGRATGELSAWLNCDEQYLPNALQKVARHFFKNSETGLVCGDALLVTPDGQLITYRKNPPLRRAYILADHLYAQSAALFFRSSVFSSGYRFDPRWRAAGDCDFITRVLEAGFCCEQIRDYLATCAMTGKNLSRRIGGVEELQTFRRAAPSLYRRGRPVWNLLRHVEKLIRGGYCQSVPLEYDLYTEHSEVRKKISAQKVDFKFRWDACE